MMARAASHVRGRLVCAVEQEGLAAVAKHSSLRGRRRVRSSAPIAAVRYAIETLERRVMLSAVSFAPADYATGPGLNSVVTGDFNGDGKLDLVAANEGPSDSGNSISVLLNNGNGTFATKEDYVTGRTPYSIAIGDFNGDGKLDLA